MNKLNSKSKEYIISTDSEKNLKKSLLERKDVEAQRIIKYLEMPDLSRTESSPLFEIIQKVRNLPGLNGFDNIVIPEIVPADISFDLFDFAPNHPARSKSDTYYVDDKNILRTHDTVMWYYYMNLPEIKEKIKNGESLGVMCYGKVYRKDEIDRKHMNIFHQMGGLYMAPENKEKLSIDDLKNILTHIVQGIFGKDIKYRFNVDTFPYTDPSLEVEVEINGQWLEILGGGMPKASVMKNFGVTGYNGWAFGFGLERLAIIGMELPDIRLLWSKDPRVVKQLKLGNKYNIITIKKQYYTINAITRDISFIVKNDFIPNNYFDLVRDLAPGLIEEVSLLDKYENEAKFGKGNISYAYRIIYRSIDRTLTNQEIDVLHKKLEEITQKTYNATIR